MGVTSLAIQFTIIDLLSKGVSSIRERLNVLSSTSQDVKRNFDKMTSSFKYAAVAGITTREMYKGIKPAIGLAGDLQQEMLKTKVELMGAGKNAQVLQNELKAIKASSFAIQAWSPFDMTQIAALEKEILKAGATVEQVTSKTGAAVAAASLATYEGVDPTETGKALIRIATPFNITADKFLELADTISKASSASTADLMDIVFSSKYAAGTMANLGRTTKEMAAMSALMAQVGLQGETGGRAIREFFDSATKIKSFKDAKGNLIGTMEIIKKLRQSLKGMGEAERMEKLKDVFGELGSQAAMALLKEGDKSYEGLLVSMDKAVGLQDKITESMKGFNKQMESLKGTFKSTIADLFQPALNPLTYIIAKTNEFIALIGEASQKKGFISKLAAGGAAATLAAGTAATIGLGTAGVLYGRKVLKGVGGVKGILTGFGSDAAGIAKGKAAEAATGVTPVFVTNWPANFGGSAASAAADMAGAAGTATKLGKAASIAGKASLVAGVPIAAYEIATMLGADKLGAWFGEKIFNVMNGETRTEVKNNIPMNVYISGDRVKVENEGMNTQANINLKRGNFNYAVAN